MPLAPQITNTPIPYSTWFVSGDYDNSSTAVVVPTSTYYAAPTPNANAIGDIWFDTTNGNKQYRWDGSSWVSVQDASIATATTTANNAYSLATTATATANGKNQVYYSSSAPGSTANNAGDIWYQYGSYGIVTAQYVGQGGTSWTSVTLTNVTVSSITAGAITAGTITTAVGITNPSGNFTVNGTTGYLTCSGANVSGTITATAGSIAGFTIGSSQLSNSQMTIYSNGNITSLGTINAYYVAAGISLTSAGTLIVTGNSTLGNTTTTTYLTINNTANIVGGYGITSDWSPNTDNTYNLGISGSRRWSHVYAYNTAITTSDSRLKTNVATSALGLNFINSLRPVSYQWIEGGKQLVLDDDGKPIVESTDDKGKPVYKTESVPGKRTHYGLIAQEVKAALDAANVGDFAGWVQDDMSNPDSFQSISYEQFISPLIKAVQELSAEIQTLKGATNGTTAS